MYVLPYEKNKQKQSKTKALILYTKMNAYESRKIQGVALRVSPINLPTMTFPILGLILRLEI